MAKNNFKEEIAISDRYSRKLISGKVTATAGIHNPETLKMVYGFDANRIDILRKLEKQNKFNLIWYIIFLSLGLVCFIIYPKSWFSCLDLVVLMINIDLVAQGKIIGVYIGIIECFMYAFICFTSGLYGEVIKMLIMNLPLNIFTVISWSRNLKAQKKTTYKSEEESNSGSVTVRKLALKHYWWLALVFIGLFALSYFGLSLLHTSALWLSALVFALGIYQKIFSALCYKENWWFSILSTGISIFMWVQVIWESSATGLDLTVLPQVVETIAYFVNSIYAYGLWKSMYRQITVNGGDILVKRKVKINKIIKLRHRYQQLIWNKKIDMDKNS